jgi:hypothetical protein
MVIEVNGMSLRVDNVVVDTGSATTAIEADILALAGVEARFEDIISIRQGIGGEQSVVVKSIDKITVGELEVTPFEVDVAGLDYGMGIQGFLRCDFLLRTGAIIDLKTLQLRQG